MVLLIHLAAVPLFFCGSSLVSLLGKNEENNNSLDSSLRPEGVDLPLLSYFADRPLVWTGFLGRIRLFR